MPRSLETKFANYFNLPNPGLRAYFQHVVAGQPEEYRTPFYRGKSVETVVNNWLTRLEAIKQQSNLSSLYDYEIDCAGKVGPMSIMKPLSERMDDIDAYYDLISKDQIPIDPRAVARSLREWKRITGLRIRSQYKTVEAMKKSTNSGSPFFQKRSSVLNKTLPCYVEDYGHTTKQWLTQDLNEWDACAVLGWRGQEGGPKPDDVKQRVVWMFPFAVNVEELSLYQPLIAAMQKVINNTAPFPAWVSLDLVDYYVTQMFDTTRTEADKYTYLCTDFTKFDQHFNRSLQQCAHQCIQHLFKGDPGLEDWLDQVFPIKYNIPLAYDYGKIRIGPHGMASGSGGTNADESLVHRTLQHEAAMLQDQELNPYSQCLGDDGVLTFKNMDVDKVLQSYCSHGLDMNPSKQYESRTSCIYLRRWHDVSYRVNDICVGVYATTRALGRLCEQERYYDPEVWGPKMVALRQLSILENCKYHPMREEFVAYCMKGDRFRLGLDIPGFLDNIAKIAQDSIDYMPDFMGYTRSLTSDGNIRTSGIADWWIVKYLKSLA